MQVDGFHGSPLVTRGDMQVDGFHHGSPLVTRTERERKKKPINTEKVRPERRR